MPNSAPYPGRHLLSTTSKSILHRVYSRPSAGGISEPKVFLAVITSVLLSYVPMLLLAWGGDLPITSQSQGVKLPMLWDVNVMFMFLVSLPVLIALAVSDDSALNNALNRVQTDGVLTLKPGSEEGFAKKWRVIFVRLNVGGTALALVVGVLTAYSNYGVSTTPGLGAWVSGPDAVLRPEGWVFIVATGFFYSLVAFYAIRSLGMVLFLRSLVKISDLRLLPGHPDHSGGLRPVGALGLRNQYALTVLGLNLLLLVFVTVAFLDNPRGLWYLVAAGTVAYGLVGPAAFLGPLLPFRAGMKDRKAELLGEVAERLNRELLGLRSKLKEGDITKRDEEILDRLRKVGGIIEELPVWPFDANTLRRFLSAYIFPLLGAAASPFWLAGVQKVLKLLS